MKLTNKQLKQIIKEELSHVINENVNADVIRRLANDKVLYYHAKGSVDDYMGEEISDEAFVDIINNLPMQPTGDTVDNIVKDAIWRWLGNEEVFQSMGRERTFALAADGMKQWGQRQVQLGSYQDRLARYDAETP